MESQPRLLDQMREVLRLKHLSFRTEEAYISWAKRFILFHDKRHPRDMGAAEIRAFLSYLATHEHVAASTQNSALNALLFLYRSVLKQPFPHLEDIERAKRPCRLPTVFSREEVHAILTRLTGMPHLMTSLLYGAGLRLMECVRLRVKDVDFTYHQITVRDGKGAQDRVTMLPRALVRIGIPKGVFSGHTLRSLPAPHGQDPLDTAPNATTATPWFVPSAQHRRAGEWFRSRPRRLAQ